MFQLVVINVVSIYFTILLLGFLLHTSFAGSTNTTTESS